MSPMEYLLQAKAQALGLPPELANIEMIRKYAQQAGMDMEKFGKPQTRQELLASHESQMVNLKAQIARWAVLQAVPFVSHCL